ncbi:MAG: zf-HC2 domain-containing protein [Gemmatimonadaceae bacterium]
MPNAQPKMDCGKALQKMFDFLDGELSPERMQSVRDHLEGCGPCLDHADFERRFLAALQATREDRTCPAEVRAKVMASLRAAGLNVQ